MPKFYEFPIDGHQSAWIFKPLRTKKDGMILLMRTIKIILLGQNLPPPRIEVGKIVLYVSKMSRIFFVSPRKIFSIALPFTVEEEDGRIVFRDALYPMIDSKLTSDIISLLDNEEAFATPDIYAFVEHICPLSDYDVDLWQIFRKLLMAEEGYIRYDFDEAHADGHRHPVHHLDIFYESHASFKLGLTGPINRETFQEILDLTTNCHYATEAV